MITLTPSDYMIISMVCLAVALRIIGDIRDILEAKLIKNALSLKGEQKLSPGLTIILPFGSLETTKRTLEHLSDNNFSSKVVVVIDSNIHARYTSALRYFVRKHSMKQVVVTARKNPIPPKVAREYAKTGLIVILPDMCRLQESFYNDVTLPFADKTVDALQLMPSVRTDKTLGSGIEVLFTAWRRYIGVNGVRRSVAIPGGSLPEGMIMRAKFLRKPPKIKFTIIALRRPVYSISAANGARSIWSQLQKSAGVADYGTALIIAAATLLLLQLSRGLTIATGVYALVYVLLVWWSLSTTRVSLADRISVVLLSPFFFVSAVSFIIARIAQHTTRLIKKIKASRTRFFMRRHATPA